MLSANDFDNPEYIEKITRLNALARREDLVDVMGFSLAMPPHGTSPSGEVRWGVRNLGGMADQKFIESFESDVIQILSELREYQWSPESNVELEPARSQPYSTGPAAQEWSTLFFELAVGAMAVLSAGDVLISWGVYLRAVIRKLKEWEENKTEEAYRQPDLEPDDYRHLERVRAVPVFTVPALTALCYEHCVGAYGVGAELKIDMHPRTAFAGYTSAGHPTANESFVIQMRDRKRQFFYIVAATGEVNEHFLVTGKDVTLLPLPSFDGESTSYRCPEDRIELGVTTVRRCHQDSFIK